MKYFAWSLALLLTAAVTWFGYHGVWRAWIGRMVWGEHLDRFGYITPEVLLMQEHWFDRVVKWHCAAVAGLALLCLAISVFRSQLRSRPNWKWLGATCAGLVLAPGVLALVCFLGKRVALATGT